MKCETSRCHRRKKMDVAERRTLRGVGDEYGVRAGIMCPSCVAEALQDEERFAVDMSLGEVMVQLTREDAPWRIVLVPDPALTNQSNPVEEEG